MRGAGGDGRDHDRAPATFDHRDFPLARLLDKKQDLGARVQVCIPARNEAATIGAIVSVIASELTGERALVDDLVVVDDASTDGTGRIATAAGARVVPGPGSGKGEAMARGLEELTRLASGGGARRGEELVVFLDGDVTDFSEHFVRGLVGPLCCQVGFDLVKGRYRRPLGGRPEGGGRVTELAAKPALELFFPALSGIDQPLAGETAARRSLLSRLELAGGYAVEAALLIDTLELRGAAAIAQVDLGVRHHRNRPLHELVPQARAVLATIVERHHDRSARGDDRLERTFAGGPAGGVGAGETR